MPNHHYSKKLCSIGLLILIILATGCNKASKPNDVAATSVPTYDIMAPDTARVGSYFYVSSTLENQSSLYHFKWDFGDGNSDNESYVMHNFLRSGKFKISLIVNNDTAHKKTKDIYVLPNYAFDTSGVLLPDSGIAMNMKFTQNPGCNYFWNFGDGTTSTDSFPVHKYADTGHYHITLVVNNDTANKATSNIRIIRNPYYTSISYGMKNWHRYETLTYNRQLGAYYLPDTSAAINYINPITISLGWYRYTYEPDASNSNQIIYSYADLNGYTIKFDLTTKKITHHFFWSIGNSEYPGDSRFLDKVYDDVWTTP